MYVLHGLAGSPFTHRRQESPVVPIHLIGLSFTFLNQQSAPVILKTNVARPRMILVGNVELVAVPSGRLFFSVHSSRSMRLTFSPFNSTLKMFLSQVTTRWFHSPIGFMAFLLGLTRS